MVSYSLLFATVLAGVHSFSFVGASVAEAAAALITQAPSPTIAKRQATPILSTLHFAYSNLPEQVYPFAVLRGPQFGFNICNSSTLGPTSNCQTLIFNGPDDFCLWGSPDPNGQIGNVEAKVVAYCTKPYHGTRLIPANAITGLQWMKTSAYIQVTGFISNPGIGLDPADSGGELDPHGADLQGNPLGGVVFSNGTSDSPDGKTMVQVFNWNTFVGSGQFCFKACLNSISSPDYCENRYDLVGCDYNMPSAVQNGTFTECEGDLQDVVGTYTTNGQTVTWSMPATLNSPPPYTPRTPSSSNCKTFQATDLFVNAASTSSGSAATATGTATGTGASPAKTTGAGTGSRSGSSAIASNTSTTKSSAAISSIGLPSSLLSVVLGIMAGAAFVV